MHLDRPHVSVMMGPRPCRRSGRAERRLDVFWAKSSPFEDATPAELGERVGCAIGQVQGRGETLAETLIGVVGEDGLLDIEWDHIDLQQVGQL